MIISLVFLFCQLLFTLANPIEEGSLDKFLEGNIQFTTNIYKELLKSESSNFLISPFTIEDVLALIRLGSKGPTATEITRSINLPEKEEDIEIAFQSIFPKLRNGDQSYNLSLANKIYLKNNLTISPEYRKQADRIFNVEVENANFEDENAVSSINEWVEEKTNNKIHRIVSPQDLTDSTEMLLINTLYFSGKWEKNFNEPQFTVNKKFYKNDVDVIEVNTMSIVDTFRYYECSILDAKILELPYEGEEVSMIIVLPNNKEGLKSLIDNGDRIFRAPKYTLETVKVAIPRFSIEYSLKLEGILKELGMKAAFEEADFSGILENEDEKVKISRIVQKTFINVTEDGTEAAAASAVHVTTLALPHVPEDAKNFIADHPFLFYIRSSFGILFIGHYTGL